MSLEEPPFQSPIVDENGKATVPWNSFLTQIYEGDFGAPWLPTFQGLTVVGTPTVSGRYFELSRQICVFWVHIEPATSTTSTAGTTYINNFPLKVARNGFCVAVSGGLGAQPGHIDESTNRIYTPGWAAVSVPLTVIGIAFTG